MKKRLFVYTSLIILVGLLSFLAISIYTTHTNNVRFATDTVVETAHIITDLYSEDIDITKFNKVGNNIRVTVISPDGTVLADSHPIDMTLAESHLNRPEIQAAASGSPAAYTRYSESFGVDFIYYALKTDGGSSYVFIRTAMPVASINAYLSQSLPLLIIVFCLVLLFCSVFYQVMMNRITKPFESIELNLRLLACGDYKPRRITGSYVEVDQITGSIDDVADILINSINELSNEKDKLNYIVNSIGDGLFVIDENMNIVLINVAAINIFNADPDIIGRNMNYLTYDGAVTESVGACIRQGENIILEHMIGDRIYLITVKKLPIEELTMITLSDVTEVRENAKRCEEFFANASEAQEALCQRDGSLDNI